MSSTVLTKALTFSIVAQFSAIDGTRLEGDGLTFGMNSDERAKYSFDTPQGTPDLTAARGILAGTRLADRIPTQKKGAKVDPKEVSTIKNELVYFLACVGKLKNTEYVERNRIVMAVACLGYTTLASGLLTKLNPVRIQRDGEVFVVEAPRGEDFKYHCRKNGWSYHGDSDPKWKKNPPYKMSTGEIREHVRTIPAKDEAKLMAALKDAFAERILVRENSFQFIG